MLQGEKLSKGDTIGIVAPANYVESDKVKYGAAVLRNLGFKVKFGKSCFSKWYGFAGIDEIRANDINTMFADDSVDAVLCLRGGYGSIRLLGLIDYNLIKNNPKLFIGYSDITSLHLAINKISGLATLHGPMLVSNMIDDFDELTKKSFLSIVTGKNNSIINPPDEEMKILVSGEAQGSIIGGNLSLLIASMGTPYEIDCKNKLLFIEDINEYTYKIDKNLNQLKLAGKFADCVGIILGDFKKGEKQSLDDFSLMEVFENNFINYKKPVIYNVKSGHCKPMITIPFGVEYNLNAFENNVSINLLET